MPTVQRPARETSLDARTIWSIIGAIVPVPASIGTNLLTQNKVSWFPQSIVFVLGLIGFSVALSVLSAVFFVRWNGAPVKRITISNPETGLPQVKWVPFWRRRAFSQLRELRTWGERNVESVAASHESGIRYTSSLENYRQKAGLERDRILALARGDEPPTSTIENDFKLPSVIALAGVASGLGLLDHEFHDQLLKHFPKIDLNLPDLDFPDFNLPDLDGWLGDLTGFALGHIPVVGASVDVARAVGIALKGDLDLDAAVEDGIESLVLKGAVGVLASLAGAAVGLPHLGVFAVPAFSVWMTNERNRPVREAHGAWVTVRDKAIAEIEIATQAHISRVAARRDLFVRRLENQTHEFDSPRGRGHFYEVLGVLQPATSDLIGFIERLRPRLPKHARSQIDLDFIQKCSTLAGSSADVEPEQALLILCTVNHALVKAGLGCAFVDWRKVSSSLTMANDELGNSAREWTEEIGRTIRSESGAMSEDLAAYR